MSYYGNSPNIKYPLCLPKTTFTLQTLSNNRYIPIDDELTM